MPGQRGAEAVAVWRLALSSAIVGAVALGHRQPPTVAVPAASASTEPGSLRGTERTASGTGDGGSADDDMSIRPRLQRSHTPEFAPHTLRSQTRKFSVPVGFSEGVRG